MQFSKHLDQQFLKLAWSLWTEIGVAGVYRNHQDVLILIEELILFTAALSDADPRLRDEAIDWCCTYHQFISIARLKSLIPEFKEIADSFSKFAVTLNEISTANWPVPTVEVSWKMRTSGKSVLRPHESAALLNLRARSIFGTSSRADLITFFLVHPDTNFSIAETAEVGYSKRNLAEVLDDLHFGGLFNRFMQGNQQRYRLNRESPLFALLQPIPVYPRSWRFVFKVLLNLRICFKKNENSSESTMVVELNNCLDSLKNYLQMLDLHPPVFSDNFSQYLTAFNKWLVDWATSLAEGK